MSQKQKKFLDFEIKAVDGEPRTYTFTASTDTRDRQGDILVQDEWRTADFMNNPVILWAHNYYETPIGKASEVSIVGGKLQMKIQFVPADIDPFAAKVEKLVAAKFLRTGSVGFMVYKRAPLTPDDLKQRPEMKFGERLSGDLLEFSIVPVPANPDALNQNAYGEVMARGFGLKPDEVKHRLLPYTDAKGVFSERLLRASLAAALGARGGVKINDAEKDACLNHLYRIAKEKNVTVPCLTEGEDLKDHFRDVWSAELLDVIQRADEEFESVSVKLIKGQKRKELVAARDALNTILNMQESAPPEPAKPADTETLGLIEQMTKDLTSIAAGLK